MSVRYVFGRDGKASIRSLTSNFFSFHGVIDFLSGAHNRVGFYAYHHEGLYRGELLTHKVSYNPHMHIAKNFIALVAALLSQTRKYPMPKS